MAINAENTKQWKYGQKNEFSFNLYVGKSFPSRTQNQNTIKGKTDACHSFYKSKQTKKLLHGLKKPNKQTNKQKNTLSNPERQQKTSKDKIFATYARDKGRILSLTYKELIKTSRKPKKKRAKDTNRKFTHRGYKTGA